MVLRCKFCALKGKIASRSRTVYSANGAKCQKYTFTVCEEIKLQAPAWGLRRCHSQEPLGISVFHLSNPSHRQIFKTGAISPDNQTFRPGIESTLPWWYSSSFVKHSRYCVPNVESKSRCQHPLTFSFRALGCINGPFRFNQLPAWLCRLRV